MRVFGVVVSRNLSLSFTFLKSVAGEQRLSDLLVPLALWGLALSLILYKEIKDTKKRKKKYG